MRMTWRQLLNLTLSVALVIASAPVQAIQIEIQQDIRFRQKGAGHEILGILKKGSIIEIPDSARQDNSDGTFNLHKTLRHMMQNPVAGSIGYKRIYGERMPLFKVTVIGKAAGSSYNAKIGSTTMVALDFLERRGKAYVATAGTGTQIQTGEDTPAYSASGMDDSADQPTEQLPVYCATCNSNSGPMSQERVDQMAALGSINTPPPPAASDDETAGLQGFPQDSGVTRCNRFINTDGSYGDLGRMAVTEIQQYHPDFDTSASFKDICPNYDKPGFNKEHFQVWVLASIGMGESGCRTSAPNPGAPHGVAVGVFQMEDSIKFRSRRPYYDDFCRGDMKSSTDDASASAAYANMRCALEIMDYHLVSRGTTLYSRAKINYWEVLRKKRSETHKLISQYSACGK